MNMNHFELVLEIFTYITTVVFAIVNFVSIIHLCREKNSSGVSKLAFWLLDFSFAVMAVYSGYYQLWILLISYVSQFIMISIYIALLYKYSKPQEVEASTEPEPEDIV